MRRRHFEAFAPHCPRCARDGAGRHQLTLDAVLEERDDDVLSGILHCPNPACRHEYPIIDGIPVIVPALGALLAERGIELLLREDLDPVLESLIGDAIGPGTWLDTLRQTVSTYAWDGWADLDPEEAAADPADGVQPGAVRRCLARLLDMAGTRVAGRVIDVGCGAGRTAFDLAARGEDTLVLGVDIHLALLRLARRAAAGVLSYPRRRIGIVYDRRRFPVAPAWRRYGWISGPATRSPCPSAPARPTLPWRSTCWTASANRVGCWRVSPKWCIQTAECCSRPLTTGPPVRRRWRPGSAATPSARRMAVRPSRSCGRC